MLAVVNLASENIGPTGNCKIIFWLYSAKTYLRRVCRLQMRSDFWCYAVQHMKKRIFASFCNSKKAHHRLTTCSQGLICFCVRWYKYREEKYTFSQTDARVGNTLPDGERFEVEPLPAVKGVCLFHNLPYGYNFLLCSFSTTSLFHIIQFDRSHRVICQV